MPLAPWRSPLARALYRNRSLAYSRYLQLATVQTNGQPSNRTLVFRGFLGETDQLKFAIDARSQKAEQVSHHPWGEACWYFTKTREQFRISGTLVVVKANHLDATLQQARQATWKELSDNARLQFSWPNPGDNRSDTAAFESSPVPDSEVALGNFSLLLLKPVQVDHLELRGDPQNRQVYCLDSAESWSTRSINP